MKEPSLPLADCLLFLLDLNGAGSETDLLLDVFATLSSFLLQQEAAHRVGYREGQSLALLELCEPEDARPALEAVLSAGGRAALPPLRPGGIPCAVPVLHPGHRACPLPPGSLPCRQVHRLLYRYRSGGSHSRLYPCPAGAGAGNP